MKLRLIGVNHRTAPVALRDGLAVGAQGLPGFLSAFHERFPQGEVVLLSTCNRTELYVASPATADAGAQACLEFLSQHTGTPHAVLAQAAVVHEQRDAVAHLLRVTAGLDAMAVGESQVLGQVRRAYDAAGTAGTAGRVMHRLFQSALKGARKARRESGVEAMDQSVSTMAVEFAGGLFASFADKHVAGVGAGEITKATLQRMLTLKPAGTCVVNRSAAAGAALAQTLGLGPGGARPWEQLDDVLVEADVVITGTAAPTAVITRDRFRPLLKRRRNRPLFLIDLAVPRDVEPSVGELPDVYLYNLDDLNAALAQVPGRRERIDACAEVAQRAAHDCWAALERRDVGQVVKQLRTRLLDIGEREGRRTAGKLAARAHAVPAGAGGQGEGSADGGGAMDADEIARLLDEHTHRMVNKIMHLPLSRIDPGAGHEAELDGGDLGALCRLFGLDDTAPDTDANTDANTAPDGGADPHAAADGDTA